MLPLRATGCLWSMLPPREALLVSMGRVSTEGHVDVSGLLQPHEVMLKSRSVVHVANKGGVWVHGPTAARDHVDGFDLCH